MINIHSITELSPDNPALALAKIVRAQVPEDQRADDFEQRVSDMALYCEELVPPANDLETQSRILADLLFSARAAVLPEDVRHAVRATIKGIPLGDVLKRQHAKPPRICGFPVYIDNSLPSGELRLVNDRGEVVGKIINIQVGGSHV